MMSSSNTPSMREDNLIKSTLILMQDNEKKLNSVLALNNLLSKIKYVCLEKNVEENLAEHVESIISSTKNSYELTKHHLKKVNPSAHQTEEACNRILKKKDNPSADIVHILVNMHNSNVKNTSNLRVNFENAKCTSFQKANFETPPSMPIPQPKHGPTCKPQEAWDIFLKLQSEEGEKCIEF